MTEIATVPKPKPFLEVVDGVLHIHPHEGQRRALNSNKQIVAMLCGKQSGKSVTCPVWMYQRILDWNEIVKAGNGISDGTFWAVSPSYPLQDEKLQPIFYEFFVSMLGIGKYHVQKKRLDVTITDDGGERNTYPIKFKSADHPESLASATVISACLDEAGQNAFSTDSWHECRARVGSTAACECDPLNDGNIIRAGRLLITTTLYNYSWLKTLIFDEWRRGDPNIDVIQFKSIMNPFFSRNEWETAKRILPDWKFKMSFCGEFTRPMGRIYQDFDETCIIKAFEVPVSSYKYVGVDPGIVHHSTVFLCEIYPSQPEYSHFPLADGINPIYVIYDSNIVGSTTTTVTNREHAEALLMHKDYGMVTTVVGGAASEVYFREDYKSAGIEIIEPPFKEVSAGIDTITAMLKTHQLYIFDTQKRIIKEFEEYAYKLDIDGEITPVIENKSIYHGLDSCRYVCLSIGRNPVSIANGFLSVAGESMLDAV